MPNRLRSLPVHPRPRPGEYLARWMERLAAANRVEFCVLFRFIRKHVNESGLETTLAMLTGVPVEIIKSLDNPFRVDFWKSPAECPFKGCGYKTKNEHALLANHLAYKHELGVEWFYCPYCMFKSKYRSRFKKHLGRKHYMHEFVKKCPKCNERVNILKDMNAHLKIKHDINIAEQRFRLTKTLFDFTSTL